MSSDDIAAVAAPANEAIHFVTTDKLGDTGSVNYTFLFELPEKEQDDLLHRLWGYFWRSDNREEGRAFNLFGVSGLKCGGGFDGPDMSPDWRLKMLENLPGTVMLTSTENYEWFMEHVAKHHPDFPVERHHVDKPLFTS